MPDYARLAAHLATQSGSRAVLTLAEIGAIISGPLPLIARLHRAWWGDHRMGRRAHGAAWVQVE
jgi:hypothetical protein